MEHKKGTGQRPAPKENNQLDCSRLQSFCLGVSMIAILISMIAYLKHSDRAMFLSLGMMLYSILVQAFIDKEDNEND
jgi:hypothetical protein